MKYEVMVTSANYYFLNFRLVDHELKCLCVRGNYPPFLQAKPFYFHSSFLALKTSNRDMVLPFFVPSIFNLEPSNIQLEVFSVGKLVEKICPPPPPPILDSAPRTHKH